MSVRAEPQAELPLFLKVIPISLITPKATTRVTAWAPFGMTSIFNRLRWARPSLRGTLRQFQVSGDLVVGLAVGGSEIFKPRSIFHQEVRCKRVSEQRIRIR